MNIDLYAKGAEPVHYRAGEVIFHRDDEGDVLFVVAQGEVELVLEDGSAVRVGEGESFGEMSIIDRRPRSADAIAVTDVELHPISRGLFLVLVQETPHFALEVMRSLSDRLRRTNAQRAS